MAYMPFGVSLDGTLNGMDVSGLLETQVMQELSRRAAAAQQAAGTAQSQYETAAAAPPPMLSPADVFVPSLLNNLASVIGGTPSYRENEQERQRGQQQDLMRVRQENLQALHSISLQKAQAAEAAGNLLEAEKARKAAETQAKALQTMKDQASLAETKYTQDQTTMRSREQNASAEKIARIYADARRDAAGITVGGISGGGEGANATLEAWAQKVESGEVPLSAAPANIRRGLVPYMENQGRIIVPDKVRTTIATLNSARNVVEQMKVLALGDETHPGILRAERPGEQFKEGAKALVGGAIQSRPEVAQYNRLKQGLATTLSRGTGERGNLANRDIQRAIKLIPGIFDLRGTGEGLFDEVLTYFDQLESEQLSTALTTRPNALVQQLRTGAAAESTRPRERMVKMVAPDGTEATVPASKVEGYKARGARVKGAR